MSSITARPPLSDLRVLVVDDDEFMRTILPHMLRTLGIQHVATADGGVHGLVAYDAALIKPDLVLCDLHMPGTDGFQFMEQLAERRYPGAIILVSGTAAKVRASATLMARFHRLNVLQALEKPVDLKSLAEALTKLYP